MFFLLPNLKHHLWMSEGMRRLLCFRKHTVQSEVYVHLKTRCFQTLCLVMQKIIHSPLQVDSSSISGCSVRGFSPRGDWLCEAEPPASGFWLQQIQWLSTSHPALVHSHYWKDNESLKKHHCLKTAAALFHPHCHHRYVSYLSQRRKYALCPCVL